MATARRAGSRRPGYPLHRSHMPGTGRGPFHPNGAIASADWMTEVPLVAARRRQRPGLHPPGKQVVRPLGDRPVQLESERQAPISRTSGESAQPRPFGCQGDRQFPSQRLKLVSSSPRRRSRGRAARWCRPLRISRPLAVASAGSGGPWLRCARYQRCWIYGIWH